MVRVVWDDPQTPSKDLRGHLAADGVAVHGCAGEAFSARTPQTGWPEVRRTACGVSSFFFASYAWRQKKEAFLEKHLRPTGTFDGWGGPSCWGGCVVSAGTGNPIKVEGRVDSTTTITFRNL